MIAGALIFRGPPGAAPFLVVCPAGSCPESWCVKTNPGTRLVLPARRSPTPFATATTRSRVGAVAVAMYDDHLEITNPGTFHFGITPKELVQPHESKPWNPIIANVFYRAGIIERWGSGTLNILDWCKENGNPSPTWREQTTSIYVVFHPPTYLGHQVGTKLAPSTDSP